MPADQELRFALPTGVPFIAFIQAQEHFLELAAEVARERAGRGRREPVTWVVSGVKVGSVELLARPRSNRDDISDEILPQIVHTIADGLHKLQREPKRPPYFTDAALQSARALAEVLKDQPDTPRIEDEDVVASIGVPMVKNIDAILTRDETTLHSIGTVEGRLETLQLHAKRYFNLYDELTGDRIECHFGERIDVADIADAIKQGGRVSVYGRMVLGRDGKVKKALAESLELLPDPTTLPKAADVRGILREYMD